MLWAKRNECQSLWLIRNDNILSDRDQRGLRQTVLELPNTRGFVTSFTRECKGKDIPIITGTNCEVGGGRRKPWRRNLEWSGAAQDLIRSGLRVPQNNVQYIIVHVFKKTIIKSLRAVVNKKHALLDNSCSLVNANRQERWFTVFVRVSIRSSNCTTSVLREAESGPNERG